MFIVPFSFYRSFEDDGLFVKEKEGVNYPNIISCHLGEFLITITNSSNIEKPTG